MAKRNPRPAGPGLTVLDTPLTKIVTEKPFYAHLLLRFQRWTFKSPKRPIGMSVTDNGPNLFVDPEAFEVLPESAQMALLEHVVLHLLCQHPLRRRSEHVAEVWDVACDVAVNQYVEGLPENCWFLKDLPFLEKEEPAEKYHDEVAKRLRGAGEAKGSGAEDDEPFELPEKELADDHGKWDESTGDPDLQREQLKQMIKEAAEVCDRDGWGDLPGAVKSLVEDYRKVQENWKAVLDRFISFATLISREETRKRPSRRFGYAFPGQRTKASLRLALCVDTSGSISDDMLAEFNARMEHLAEYVDMVVIECDAAVQRVYEATRKIDKAWFGRGGTNFVPALRKAEELEVDAAIYLTDGYGTFPDRVPPFPVLWALTPTALDRDQFPFGHTMKLKTVSQG